MRGFLLAAILVVAAPSPALARSERVVGWSPDRVFPTAVRFLRIDEGVTIVEKDADAGYVMFELTDEGKVYPGALELVAGEDGKLTLVLRIEDRPEYMEIGMLDRLERKLRDELGPPPKAAKPDKKPARPAPKPGDAPPAKE